MTTDRHLVWSADARNDLADIFDYLELTLHALLPIAECRISTKPRAASPNGL